MAKADKEGSSSSKKKRSSSSGSSSSGSTSSVLRNVVAGAASTDALIDLVEKLGIVDLVIGRLKSRIEETDLDELFDDISDYLKRNPEVLVVSLGTMTVATGILVWLNSRREWNGEERRESSAGASESSSSSSHTTAAPGRVRRTSAA
ncbi:MAG: hypothetical protein JO197_19080 [Acidobacteria bacterium]|nr:hypothetical protein [Acidobacteriota bacterium]MBV9477090.1 hypothetical protein [Acidobacteriota bacterium]